MFGLLVLTLIIAFRKQQQFNFLHRHEKKLALLITIFYAAILEYYQGKYFVARTTDPLDFVADSVGAFLGILFFRLIYGRALFRSPAD